MFEPQQRFATKTVTERLDMGLQMILWSIIDTNQEDGKEMDYLQVFELTNENGRQRIVNRQEVPERKEVYHIDPTQSEPVTIKVWVIDNGTYATMLLPSDY